MQMNITQRLSRHLCFGGLRTSSATEIESMLNQQRKGEAVDNYWAYFGEKHAPRREKVVEFERKLEPSWWVIFQPWPHPPTPIKMVEKLPPEPFF